jgi:two-component system OmpR family sensor kinase
VSLRGRLTLVFALGTAALVVISGLAFLAQLRSSLNSALDDALRTRNDALAAQVRAGSLPAGAWPDTGQAGQQNGQFGGADEFAQVLTRSGTVLYPSGAEQPAPLLSRAQLAQVGHRRFSGTTAVEGEQVRVMAGEARWHARSVIVVTGATIYVASAAQARARLIILIGGPLAVAAAGLGAWLLTGAALRPVDRMRRRLDEISERDSDARLHVPATKDEIASLAITTNRLLDRLQQALARQRGFVADAGHELRTPLTALKAELELAARPGRSQDALAAAVAAAAGDTDRLIRLAEDLLLLARADDGIAFLAPVRIDVSGLVLSAARSLAAHADARRITIVTRAQGELIATADPGRLRQALGNLIDNAIRHSPDGGIVEVTGEMREIAGDGRGPPRARQALVIEVRDHGLGFAEGFLPHAFERFRRAGHGLGRADGGTGLGLAIVASIAHAHGGEAVADNHPEGGARVRIELPLGPGGCAGAEMKSLT